MIKTVKKSTINLALISTKWGNSDQLIGTLVNCTFSFTANTLSFLPFQMGLMRNCRVLFVQIKNDHFYSSIILKAISIKVLFLFFNSLPLLLTWPSDKMWFVLMSWALSICTMIESQQCNNCFGQCRPTKWTRRSVSQLAGRGHSSIH